MCSRHRMPLPIGQGHSAETQDAREACNSIKANVLAW